MTLRYKVAILVRHPALLIDPTIVTYEIKLIEKCIYPSYLPVPQRPKCSERGFSVDSLYK